MILFGSSATKSGFPVGARNLARPAFGPSFNGRLGEIGLRGLRRRNRSHIGRAHIDDPHCLDARLGRFKPEQGGAHTDRMVILLNTNMQCENMSMIPQRSTELGIASL